MFESYKITLASASPRRRDLLAGLDIDFTVEPAKDEKELFSADMPQHEVPEFLALHKSESFHRELEENEILITADTLVFVDGAIIGKPADREDAIRMLQMLSGKTHQVITGVVLRANWGKKSFSDSTDVMFKTLTDEQIAYYIDKYKPYDKAGSYGVQEWIGYAGIVAINGSFYNVMGLPVQRLYEELCEFTKN